MRSRGYGEAQVRGLAIAFNRPTGERWDSGGEKRVYVGGLRHEQWVKILRYSEDPVAAANATEAAILGKGGVPEAPEATMSQPSLTMEMVDRLVTNRVGSEVSRLMGPVHEQIVTLSKQLQIALEAIAAPVKRGGRPKGSKNKPKTPTEPTQPSEQAPASQPS